LEQAGWTVAVRAKSVWIWGAGVKFSPRYPNAFGRPMPSTICKNALVEEAGG